MKVNHNMSAVVTNAQLLKTEGGLAASMERLSSGLKINHAKDDPAGMAISNKMQAQIDGLGKASENASNGISVLQIADSALGEVTSILQRIRELSVQAATDTNQQEERAAIQQEINSLTEEVDRISRDTEYNTQTLLDGSFDTRVYGEGFSRMAVTDAVRTGDYKFTIAAGAAAKQGSVSCTPSSGTVPAGSVIINGVEVVISEGEDISSVYEKLRTGAETAGVNLIVADRTQPLDFEANPTTGGYTQIEKTHAQGDTLAFISDQFGEGSSVEIVCSNADLQSFLGLDGGEVTTPGENADITLDLTSSFGAQATVSMDGNKVKITDISGFQMDFMVEPGKTGDFNIQVTDIGTMTLQIGANENQTMEVRIPEISKKTLYLDEVDVTKAGGASKAIHQLDQAISITSSARSAIGAYQNRLEHAVDSLDSSQEDLTNAISRIGDTDMAKEMSEYTKYTVLQQAGTSVLAQANDIPQTVLQLLQ